jgi:nitrite reductase/ring-hydroxylating ferredoxin subunit
MLLRLGDRAYAIADTCTHQGAPLHRGPVDRRSGTPIATCPAHGSMFDLATGAVRRGPAQKPVRAYEVRVNEGSVEVRVGD